MLAVENLCFIDKNINPTRGINISKKSSKPRDCVLINLYLMMPTYILELFMYSINIENYLSAFWRCSLCFFFSCTHVSHTVYLFKLLQRFRYLDVVCKRSFSKKKFNYKKVDVFCLYYTRFRRKNNMWILCIVNINNLVIIINTFCMVRKLSGKAECTSNVSRPVRRARKITWSVLCFIHPPVITNQYFTLVK